MNQHTPILNINENPNLHKALTDAKYVLCGEIHGAKENLIIYQELLSSNLFQGFAYELPTTWQPHLQKYVSGKEKNIPDKIIEEWTKMAKRGHADGKISRELIRFFQYIKNQNTPIQKIKLLFFDPANYPNGFSWNERDKQMYKTLLQKWPPTTPGRLLIATGSLHSKSGKFIRHHKTHIPLGYRLAKHNSLCINIKYQKGSYFNLTEKQIDQQNKTLGIQQTDNKHFTITLPVSHPITPLANRNNQTPAIIDSYY